MSLRCEIFHDDLDRIVDFYVRVLRFELVRDERTNSPGYVYLRRDGVNVGAAERAAIADLSVRRPPVGVELVLEVDDIDAELHAVEDEDWPVDQPLTRRPWGLIDFRILDPAGHYLRLTGRYG